MQVLTRRVLPNQAKDVKADVKLLSDRGTSTVRAVQALQRHLRAAGVYSGPVSGTFDEATQTSLKAFQTAKKLPATGKLNRATLKALKQINLFVQSGFAGKTPARIGQRGSDIKAAEAKLAKLGFLSQSEVDGIFDKDTGKAVERYRKADAQVPDSGKYISENFYKELSTASKAYDHAAYRRRDVTDAKGLKQHTQLDALVASALKKETDGAINAGAKGRVVQWVQKHLEAAGYELGAENGTFNSRTEAAVRAFQQHSGLPVTGAVDAKTWAKLKGTWFGATSSVSPSQRAGEKSAAVLRTEKLLKALGYKSGAVDGYYSSATTAAVKRFQTKHHLKATGKVGEGTLNALKKAQWHAGTWKPGPGKLYGGDFSHYQSDATFNKVVRNSKWGAIKATEGTGYTDPTFRSRWNTMGKLIKQGKMKLRMAYAFLQPGNGVAQAKHLLAATGIKGKLPAGTRLVLDWEAAALSSPKTLHDAANYLHKVTGVWPVVYASASQLSRVKAAAPHAFIWSAQWSGTPSRSVPFVQYSDGPGYDHDVFNGGLKALEKFAGWTA